MLSYVVRFVSFYFASFHSECASHSSGSNSDDSYNRDYTNGILCSTDFNFLNLNIKL